MNICPNYAFIAHKCNKNVIKRAKTETINNALNFTPKNNISENIENLMVYIKVLTANLDN